MLDFDLLKDCYGCGACVNVCPRGAVHMTQAADGSYIPEIDEARCIGCGRCTDEGCVFTDDGATACASISTRTKIIRRWARKAAMRRISWIHRRAKRRHPGACSSRWRRKCCGRAAMCAAACGMSRWTRCTSSPISWKMLSGCAVPSMCRATSAIAWRRFVAC